MFFSSRTYKVFTLQELARTYLRTLALPRFHTARLCELLVNPQCSAFGSYVRTCTRTYAGTYGSDQIVHDAFT